MKKIFLEQFARIGMALSNHSRLALLDLLCQSEKSVEVLVQQSGLELKNVSAQLRVLKEVGILTSRKEGKYVYYSVSDESVPLFWSQLQSFASNRLSDLQEVTNDLLAKHGTLESVDRNTLKKRAEDGEVIVIDVRPRDEYEHAHLSFAVSLPLDELKSKLKSLPKDKEIVAYCRGPYCLLSAEAVETLRATGFKALRLDDGIQEFKDAGLPVLTKN